MNVVRIGIKVWRPVLFVPAQFECIEEVRQRPVQRSNQVGHGIGVEERLMVAVGIQKSLTAADEKPIEAERPPCVIHSPEARVVFRNVNSIKSVKFAFIQTYFATNIVKIWVVLTENLF